MNVKLNYSNTNTIPENLQSDDYVTKLMFSYCKFLALTVPIYLTASVGSFVAYKRYEIRKQFEEVFSDCSNQLELKFINDIQKPFIENGILFSSLSTSKSDLLELHSTTVCKPDC